MKKLFIDKLSINAEYKFGESLDNAESIDELYNEAWDATSLYESSRNAYVCTMQFDKCVMRHLVPASSTEEALEILRAAELRRHVEDEDGEFVFDVKVEQVDFSHWQYTYHAKIGWLERHTSPIMVKKIITNNVEVTGVNSQYFAKGYSWADDLSTLVGWAIHYLKHQLEGKVVEFEFE